MDTHHIVMVATLDGRFEHFACRECPWRLTVDHHTGDLRHIHLGAPDAMHMSGGVLGEPPPAGR